MKTTSISHIEDYDESQPYRILCLRMIEVALQDAMGHNLAKQNSNRKEIIADGRAFFHDGRYRHWAILLGIDPDVLPEEVE